MTIQSRPPHHKAPITLSGMHRSRNMSLSGFAEREAYIENKFTNLSPAANFHSFPA